MKRVLSEIYFGTSRRAALGILAIMAAGLIVTAYFAEHEWIDARREAGQEFEAGCREILAKVQIRLAAHEQVLRSAGAFFADDDGVSRAEWREFVERQKLEQSLPGIFGLGFAQIVSGTSLAEHVRSLQAEGFPNYGVWPIGDRDIYAATIFIEPFVGRNQRTLGYDMLSDPVLRAAMERARDDDAIALSGKVPVVQVDAREPQPGVLMFAPVYRMGAPHATVAERRAALTGWAFSPYSMGNLISEGLLGRRGRVEQQNIRLEIFDGESTAPSALLYDSQPQRAHSGTPSATHESSVAHAGRTWTLRFSSADRSGTSVNYNVVWLILCGGSVVSLLLAGLALSAANTRYAARRMAERLTAELRASEERWKFALEGAGDGVWDWDIASGEIYYSPRWKEMLGYAPDEIGSTLKEWSDRVHPDDLPRAMADVQAHLDGGTATYANEHRIRCKDGSWKWVLDRGLVVARNVGGSPLRMIGTHTDITARKQTDHALRQSEERFRATVEASPVPMAVNNDQGQILLLNHAFVGKFGYTLDDIPTLSQWWQQAYPDPTYRQWINDVWAKELERSLQTSSNFEPVEANVHCKNGTVKTVLVSAAKIPGSPGNEHLVALHDITARKQTESALRESEERLRTLLESSPEAIAVHRRGKILYVNPAAIAFTGATSAADLLGTSLLDRVHPDFRPLVQARVQKMTSKHTSVPVVEMTFLKLDGTPFDVEVQATEITYGGEPAIRVVARNITEFKRATAALRASEENYRLIFEGMLDGFALHEIICDAEGRPVDYRYLSVNPAFERLTGQRATDVIGRTVLELMPSTEPSWIERFGRVALTGEGVEFEDYSGALKKYFEVSAFCPRPGQFAVVFIDITDRKLAETALRESEERYRALVDWSPEAIVVHRDGKFVYGNPTAIRMIGAKASSDLFDQPILARIHPDYHDLVRQRAKLAAESTAPLPMIELKFVRVDGVTIDVETQITPIIYNGTPALQVSARDITARKRAEAELHASQAIIGGILNTIPARVFWKDKNLVYLGCNVAFARDAGFSDSSDLIGKDDYQMGWRNEADAYRADDRQVIESGSPKLFIEETQTTPDGKTIVLLTSKVPLRNAAGEITGVLGTYSDITKWKQSEAALRASEARYRSILNASPDNITITDLAGRLQLVSPASFGMFGYPPDVDVSSYRIQDFVVPEQRERASTQLALKARGVVVGPTEYHGLRRDGSTFDIEVNSDFLRDESGYPTGFVFVIRDITARKQAEAAIRAGEELFRSYIEHAPMGVFIADATGAYSQVNAAAAQTTGYTVEELVRMRIRDLLPDGSEAAGEMHFRRLVETGQSAGESSFRRKDGSVGYWFVDAVRLSPTRYLAFTLETTDRKAAELALQTSLREKDALLKEVHHRVKNNLQVITSLLRMEGRRSTQPAAKSVLTEMQGRIRSMALLHESLYRSGTFAGVDLAEYLKQLVTQAFRTQATAPGTTQLHLDLASVHVEMDQALPCGLLVNELLSNSLKHAFPAGRPGSIHVRLQPSPDNPARWCLQVSDDGIGLPADVAARRADSLGLQLVGDLAGQLQGTFEFGPAPTGPGVLFTVCFAPADTKVTPLPAAPKPHLP